MSWHNRHQASQMGGTGYVKKKYIHQQTKTKTHAKGQ
jgi:hypothetical protein